MNVNPLLVVIVTFGLIFVVTASLAQGISVAKQPGGGPLKGKSQTTAMILIGNFAVMPALLIGLAAIIDFHPQVKMAIVVLAITAGAPFIPWLVSLAKGDLAYSVGIAVVLMLVTIVVLPLALPPLLDALDTGAKPSAWLILWPLLLFMALPMLVGVILRARHPEFALNLAGWLGPISVTVLAVHVCLFLGYSWNDFTSLAGAGQMTFCLVFPLAGLLVGYLLSPPYVLSPLKPADPNHGTKIVAAVAVAQQNTGAVICCAVFPLGKYLVAGDFVLLGAIVTIVVVLVFMLEIGKASSEKQAAAAPLVPATAPVPQGATQ